MKYYRYVIGGIAFAWQEANLTSLAKMNTVAKRLTEDFGNNWNIEYR